MLINFLDAITVTLIARINNYDSSSFNYIDFDYIELDKFYMQETNPNVCVT